MPEEIAQGRRRFLGTAAMAIAAAEFGIMGCANTQSPRDKNGGSTHDSAGGEQLVPKLATLSSTVTLLDTENHSGRECEDDRTQTTHQEIQYTQKEDTMTRQRSARGLQPWLAAERGRLAFTKG